MDFTIYVCPQKLTDDSLVYDVRFGKATLKAITEADAHVMADKIAEAINVHSNDLACVVTETL